MTRLALLLVGLAVAALRLAGQEPTPRFEVASVKPNTSRDARPNVDATPGRFTATAVTLRQLIGMGYSVTSRIIGGPDWLDTDRFDIVATGGPTDPNIRPAPGAVSPREGAALKALQVMLRELLRDRFGLRVRSEQRDLPIYSLIRSRTDRFGMQLFASLTAIAQRKQLLKPTRPAPLVAGSSFSVLAVWSRAL